MNRVTSKKDLLNLIKGPLGKKIDQISVEKCIAELWHSVKPRERCGQEQFVMMFPPPNITGNLHLGHALTATIQDALVRQRKMMGSQVSWIPGFDHAGLATQIVVEGLIWRRDNLTRHQVGKDELVNLANSWKDQKRSEMRDQLARLGLLLDREKEYFTLDENSSRAVSVAFKQLFEDGIIYRSVKDVYWSAQLSTTLSDIEVDTVEGEEVYSRTGERVCRRPVSQWFINARKMAHKAVNAVEEGAIEIIPSNYKRSWSVWLVENGVKDWCISRQGWWGHKIPAYKVKSASDVTENWTMADSASEASEKLGTSQIVQDQDVLDTWFSSSLLPLTISGWPDQDLFERNRRCGTYPLSLMETGFDILTHWVSKMVMMSLALTNTVPFKTVLLHGMICDSNGKKMSKSKGNVIDPLDVIEGTTLGALQERTRVMGSQGLMDQNNVELAVANQRKLFPTGIPTCGADGLRAYLLSHDIQEEVIKIQIAQIDKVRRLSNKIWNVYRLVLSVVDACDRDSDIELDDDVKSLDMNSLDKDDLEVLANQAQCIVQAYEAFYSTYQLQHCFNKLEYFWSIHLSNNYLVKNRSKLLDQNKGNPLGAIKLNVALKCLITSTKLLYPFMPYLSEFLYQKLMLKSSKVSTRSIDQLPLLEFQTYPNLEEWSRFLSGD